MFEDVSDEESESGPSQCSFLAEHKVAVSGCCCCGILLAIILPLVSLRTVQPAHLGLVITFGKISDSVLSSGTHVTNPFASVKEMPTKTLLLEQSNRVPTSEGLMVELDVAMLYHIDPSKARDIYLDVGDNYENVVITPQIASTVRSLTSQNPAEALYNGTRDELQTSLEKDMKDKLAPKGIRVESCLFNDLKLPDQLTKSIEEKAKAQQEAERMQFILQKEEQEAKRKKIEAQGIQDFQTEVAKGINSNFLRWKGIEATEKFSSSSNPKVVIMGNTKDSLPVIMNGAG